MSRGELVEYAEKEEDCFCFHCVFDVPTREHPAPGIMTKIVIPAATWWELHKGKKTEFFGFDPLPPGKLNLGCTLAAKVNGELVLQSRDLEEISWFTGMAPGRLEIETAEEGKAFVVDLPGLGVLREKAGRLREFLRRWEDEKCRAERKRLNYSNHFPALGKMVEIPEVEVIHSEACKLKAAREQYEGAWEDYNEALKQAFTPSDSEPMEHPAPPSVKHPDSELHRGSLNPLTEQVIGRLVISKMSKNDGKFFERLADMAKNLEIEQAKTAKPETATDRKRQILFVASKLIQTTFRLPSKAELLAEADSEFSKGNPLDEREFRRNLKALGLSGLPASE